MFGRLVQVLTFTGALFGALSASFEVAHAQIPNGCGLSVPDYGPISRGSRITLGRHSEWRGEDNWSAPMDPYVGANAEVTELAGLDDSGCTVVRVDLDGGSFAWRIRDMQLSTGDSCGLQIADYGPLQIGSQVIVNRHREWNGDDNWSPEMNAFVGRTARVLDFSGLDPAGCAMVHLDVDGGQYAWRARDMSLATSITMTGAAPATTVVVPSTATPMASSTAIAPRSGAEPTDDPDDLRFPVAYADRPVILPDGTISINAGASLDQVGSDTGVSLWGRPTTPMSEGIGMAFGFADVAEVGFSALGGRLAPGGAELTNLGAYLRFRWSPVNVFEVAGQIGLVLPFRTLAAGSHPNLGDHTRLSLSLPILVHLNGIGRLDLTPIFYLGFNGDSTNSYYFQMPLEISFQLGEYVYLGGETGFGGDTDAFLETMQVPLGFFAGIAVPDGTRAAADIQLYFRFPSFGTGTRISPSEVRFDVVSQAWSLGLSTRIYFAAW